MKKVTIYTTPTCGFCKMAKDFFKQYNVTFLEKDVAADRAAAEEMIEKSGQMGVPVTVIAEPTGEEAVVVGFDRRRLATVLGIPL